MYQDYAAYTAMGGTLSEAAFTRLEYRAERQIHARTFGRITESYAAAKSTLLAELTFELIGLLSRSEAAGSLKSESVGDLSVTYADGSEADGCTDALISSYLAGEKTAEGIPLLFRGVIT